MISAEWVGNRVDFLEMAACFPQRETHGSQGRGRRATGQQRAWSGGTVTSVVVLSRVCPF